MTAQPQKVSVANMVLTAFIFLWIEAFPHNGGG